MKVDENEAIAQPENLGFLSPDQGPPQDPDRPKNDNNPLVTRDGLSGGQKADKAKFKAIKQQEAPNPAKSQRSARTTEQQNNQTDWTFDVHSSNCVC